QDRFRDRYDDRDRRDDRGGQDSYRQDSYRPDSYRRDDYRVSGDRYGDRGSDRYERREESRDDRGEKRPKLILKPRSVPKEVEQSNTPFAPSGRAASIFGGAKPVDTAAKEREVEERLKREQEKLQRQLEDRIPDRKPRERHPSWRSEDQPAERSRTGSESSQPGSQSGRASKRRESERSVDSGREEEPSSPVTLPPPRQDGQPLKVVLAPPPKENAWAKRTTPVGASSEGSAGLPVAPSSDTAPQPMGRRSIGPASSGLGERLAARDVLVPSRTSDFCGGPGAVHADTVARCTVFPPTHWCSWLPRLSGHCMVVLCFGGRMALDLRLSRVRTGVAAMRQDSNYQLDTTKLGRKPGKIFFLTGEINQIETGNCARLRNCI
uniref:Eukaryotic translation initiation factor 4Ba n=1 Tax=Salmo trutta TaxID=8032 RepID=A0A674E0G6_SALTR